MQEKTRTTLIVLGLCVVCIVLFGYFNSPKWLARPAALTDELKGTYIDGSTQGRCWLAIDYDERTFYYTDQTKEQYLVGTVENVSEGRYRIACQSAESAVLLPEQVITLADKRLTVTIDGAELIFIKNSEAATRLGQVSYR